MQFGLALGAAAATITLVGPSDVWFGVGLNASLMADKPYAIVVAGGTGSVSEHLMANHAAGTALPSSVTLVSNTVADGTRTVVLTRPLRGASAGHYTFQPTELGLDFIAAVGAGPAFGYHKDKTIATLALWPAAAAHPACVCLEPALAFGLAGGTIEYLPTGEKVGFGADRCSPQPRGECVPAHPLPPLAGSAHARTHAPRR